MILKINKTLLLIVFALFIAPTKANAQGAGMPTFDAANYVQAVQELQHMG